MTLTKETHSQDRADVKLFTLELSRGLNLKLEFLDAPESQTEEFSTVNPECLIPVFMNAPRIDTCCNPTVCKCCNPTCT
jgi:hypothetical protein